MEAQKQRNQYAVLSNGGLYSLPFLVLRGVLAPYGHTLKAYKPKDQGHAEGSVASDGLKGTSSRHDSFFESGFCRDYIPLVPTKNQ